MPSAAASVEVPAAPPTGSVQQRLNPVLVALFFAFALAASFNYIPWEHISRGGFPDRDNYLTAIDGLLQTGARFFDLSGADLLALALSEYLWRQILLAVGTFFDQPLEGFLVVSLLTSALVTYHVIRRAGVGYALLLHLCPLTIDLFISQTRSALALGIFLSALSLRSVVLRYTLFLVAFLVHSMGAVLFVAYHFNQFVVARQGLSTRAKFTTVVLVSALGSAVWGFLAQSLLSLAGDRRAFQDAILPASIPFALWWILLTAVLFAFARLKTRAANGQYVLMAIFLLGIFDFSTLMRVGALRFLSLGLPLACIAIRSIHSPRIRLGAVAGTLAFNLVYFSFYWI